jgi:hypothetical protein
LCGAAFSRTFPDPRCLSDAAHRRGDDGFLDKLLKYSSDFSWGLFYTPILNQTIDLIDGAGYHD